MESETSSCVPAAAVHHHHAAAAQHLTIGHLPTVQPLPSIRDPEWLKVEVCREYQRGMCKRTEDCRYAHPEKHIQVTEGKVIACFDALKGRCNRESCKYLHPTHLLKQHLEFAGRQTLINNRAMLQQMLPPHNPNVMQPNTINLGNGLVGYELPTGGSHQQATALSTAGLHNMYGSAAAAAAAAAGNQATYSVLQPSSATQHLYNPNLISPQLVPLYQFTASPGQQLSLAHHPHHHPHHHASPQVAAMLPSATGMRADKLEVCRDFQRGNCTRGEFECRYGHPQDRSMIDTTDNTVTVCMDCIKGRCTREKCKYFHPPAHLQAKIRAAQNPGASLLSSLTPGAIGSPQPVMLSNGNPLGQPPLKRQVMESSIISSSGQQQSLQAPSPVFSQAGATPASLAALYGYSGLLQQQALQHNQTPTYYQQAVPMFQLYGAATGGAGVQQATTLSAAAQAPQQQQAVSPQLAATLQQQQQQTASGTAANSAASNAAASYALLDGRNQLTSDEYLASKVVAIQQHRHNQQQQQSSTTALTVCRDYQSGKCVRPYCRFVHVQKDYVEVKDDKVTVCRDALQGVCVRPQCKFYHFPSSNNKLLVDPFQPQQQQQQQPGSFASPPTSIDVMTTTDNNQHHLTPQYMSAGLDHHLHNHPFTLSSTPTL